MTQGDQVDVLFPEEIIPWDEVVRLVVNLLIPFRHRAKGIECITGGFFSNHQSQGGPVSWFPPVLSENDWEFIKEHLQELPSLEFPVPIGIANEFVDKFIMLKDSPDFVPAFLTSMDLNADQQQRVYLFNSEIEQLERLVSERDVFLVDASRRKCVNLTHGVYFSKREAIQYLAKKGLLDRAFATGCSWRDQTREPEAGGISPLGEDIYYGLPQELIRMGIQEYRKTLTLRKSEVVASQLAQLHPKWVEGGQVIEENSNEKNAPAPVTVPVLGLVESGPNSVVDVIPVILVSSPPTVVNNNAKFSSSAPLSVSENYETKSMKKDPVTESEMITVCERDAEGKRLIGMKEVMERLDVSRPTIYNYLNSNSPSYNPNFPQPLKLNSENKWDESEFIVFVEALKLPKKKGTKQNR